MSRPARVATLVELLAHRAREAPERAAFDFDGAPTSHATLWRDTGRLAGRLVSRGVQPGDRVVLLLPNGPEFFAAFYGAQRAGAVPVPLFPESGPRRVLRIAERCSARAVVVPGSFPEDRRAELAAGSDPLPVIRADENGETPAGLPEPRPHHVAFIQYTSGSTGDPKGVELTHANLLTNATQLIEGQKITERDVFVSWLPLYHDLGLILMTIVPLVLGLPLTLLPASLADPATWLRAIERRRATFTAAPDFAWRLATRSVDSRKSRGDRPGPGFDLSSLRLALNAAEPVRARTVEDFHRCFGLENVMAPGYGLAEATVGVTTWPAGQPVKVDDQGCVSVGPPFPGVALKIRREGRDAGPGEVGEILIASDARCRGYHADPEATAELVDEDGYLHSGDLGYLDADGDLFVVGRKRNMIIQGGRTLAPREVEEAVDAHERVRFSAAVGIDSGRIQGEQLFVFAEVRDAIADDAEALHRAASEIVALVKASLGLRPGRVLLLRAQTLPLTPNGKVQHAALREQHVSGALRASGAVVYPTPPSAGDRATAGSAAAERDPTAGPRRS